MNGTPRTIDYKIFDAVWKACDGHKDQGYIMLALRWFRTAIQERDEINQFIYFWTPLEIANSTLRHILKKQNREKIEEWVPAAEVFDSKIKSVAFKDVKQARNDILHGNFPISPDFTAKIRKYVRPVRNATVYLIGRILGLDETFTDTITNNNILRLPLDAAVGLKGSFENLPTDTKELLESYPELITQGKPNHYSIRDTGELDVTVSTDYKATPPKKLYSKLPNR